MKAFILMLTLAFSFQAYADMVCPVKTVYCTAADEKMIVNALETYQSSKKSEEDISDLLIAYELGRPTCDKKLHADGSVAFYNIYTHHDGMYYSVTLSHQKKEVRVAWFTTDDRGLEFGCRR